jgi:hypothetical protein
MKTKLTFFSRFGSVALIGLALVAQLMTAVVAHATSVTLGWSFNDTVDPVCTSAVTKNCVTGFEYGATPDGGTTLVKIGVAPNFATTAASGATSVSVQFTQGPPLRRGSLLRPHHGPRSQRKRNLLRRSSGPVRTTHARISI